MTNKEIAKSFDTLAKVMELYNENQFKIRSYQTAYTVLKKIERPFSEFSLDELKELKGIGDAIADKIQSLVQTGEMPTLKKYIDKTPAGVIQMLGINGLGAKKVLSIWKDLGIESPGELLYACNENRLVEFKGFGAKSQATIIKNIEYLEDNQGKFLFSNALQHAEELINLMNQLDPQTKTEVTGELRRSIPIIDKIELLTTLDLAKLNTIKPEELRMENASTSEIVGIWKDFLPVRISYSSPEDFAFHLFSKTGPDPLVNLIRNLSDPTKIYKSETDIFEALSLPYLEPEMRDLKASISVTPTNLAKTIKLTDIKGIVHSHSTYSDGIHTLSDMAEACRDAGYGYLVISDHSKSAVYARGLKVEDLIRQSSEIDSLNIRLDPFIILKGIESDILTNGELDYEDEILKELDVVIASVHSVLKMDKEKATARIIKAIEHPQTNILGHPTGRILLARDGYPLDMTRIIDACRANQVAIELNANPQRLDIDYNLIDECIQKNVMISINPDAHNTFSIHDVKYGIKMARKAWLPKELCLNALDAAAFKRFCDK